MKMKRFTVLLCMFSLLIGCLCVFPAAAATTTSKVNSVTIHVKNLVEAGDFFAYDRIVDSEPEDGQVGVWTDSAQYEIAETKLLSGSHRAIPMGEVIKLRVVVEITDTDAYSFKSEFAAKNVTVSGNSGSCTSVTRSNTKLTCTIELEPVKGQYTAPDEVWWSETGSKPGLAKWDASSSGSGYYDLQLKRSGTTVKEVSGYNGTSYNFYPYMTIAGKYTVRVRAVPHSTEQKAYAKSSSWASSDSLTISSKEVSNGAGAEWDEIITTNSDGSISGIAGATSGQAGWIENNGFWYYKYPNGTFKSNGWELIGGQWYAFDTKGRMLTGWYEAPSGKYYLDTNGAMIAGWLYDGNWYYLDADASSPTYGRMFTDTFVAWNGNTYYVDAEGRMATGWTEIRGAWYYFQPGSGAMARNQWVDTFYVDQNGVWRK